jgi:hypothetical protein
MNEHEMSIRYFGRDERKRTRTSGDGYNKVLLTDSLIRDKCYPIQGFSLSILSFRCYRSRIVVDVDVYGVEWSGLDMMSDRLDETGGH